MAEPASLVSQDEVERVADELRARGVFLTSDKRVPEAAVAKEILGISVYQLRRWRKEGKGPACVQLVQGGAVYYYLDRLLAWIRSKELLSDQGGNA